MTERTAAETERPGEGKTLGEVAKEAHMAAKVAYVVQNPCGSLDAREAHAWQAAAEAIQAAVIPCTFPSCLSAQTAAMAGEEIARLKGEVERWSATEAAANIPAVFEYAKDKDAELDQLRSDIAALKAELSNLIATTKWQTFPDEAGGCKPCLAALRIEREYQIDKAYQRGVEEERERCAGMVEAEAARILSKQTPTNDPRSLDASINVQLRMMAVVLPELANTIRAASPSPQKDTAECQEVCRWDIEDHSELRGLYQTDCGYALEDKLPEYFDKTVCPRCGKPIKVGNG